jgi:hypothetical protein
MHRPYRGRRWLVMTVAMALASSTVACGGAAGIHGIHTGTASEGSPQTTSSSSTTSTTASRACGSWSSSTSTLGAAVTARYGEIRNCLLEGHTWVITTLGGHGAEGTIALYPCSSSDASCMDAQQPHPLSGWHFVKPLYPGGVTYMGTVNDHQIIVDVGGHQLTFDVLTRQFTKS